MWFYIGLAVVLVVAALVCYIKYTNSHFWKMKNSIDVMDKINATNDETLLAKAVVNCKSIKCQEAALNKISDSKILSEIASNPNCSAEIRDKAQSIIDKCEKAEKIKEIKEKIESKSIEDIAKMSFEDIYSYYKVGGETSILESWARSNKRCYKCGALLVNRVGDIPHYDSNHDYVEFVTENVSYLKCPKCNINII